MEEEKKPYEIEQEIVETTESYKKTLSYIKGLISDPVFLKKVLRIRKKCKLPESGLPDTIYGQNPKTGDRFIVFPEHLDKTSFRNELSKLSKEFGLDIFWEEMIENYIVYNNLNISVFTAPMSIIDVKNCFFGPFQYGKAEAESSLDFLREISKTNPVALFIGPYASQREIIDYVKKLYKLTIKPIQNSYKNPKIKLGKIRKKDEKITIRNEFIYQNKDLPRKDIMKLVTDTFGEVLDYGHIGKIISIEKLKRENK